MNSAGPLFPPGSGTIWLRVLSVLAAVMLLPPLYAVSGFGLFDTLRAAGAGPGGQAAVFAAGTTLVFGWLVVRAWRAGAPLNAVTGLVLIGLAGAAVNWAYPAKFVHVPQYAALGGLLALLLRGKGGAVETGMSAAVLIGFSGFSDELVQGFLSQRSFGTEDLIVDFAAGAGGYMLLSSPTRDAAMSRGGLLVFGTCCVLPCLAALGLLIFVCLRSASLSEIPPPSAFAALAGAAASCMLYVTLSRRPDAPDERQDIFPYDLAVCLAAAALGLVVIYVTLVGLPLAFR